MATYDPFVSPVHSFTVMTLNKVGLLNDALSSRYFLIELHRRFFKPCWLPLFVNSEDYMKTPIRKSLKSFTCSVSDRKL